MNKSIITAFLFILFCTSLSAQKIRVACLGNSLTYGEGVTNREKKPYPAQLQGMLGKGYEVMNFKINAYANALASKPNIVLIEPGTNDSNKELINSFSQLPTNPRIILLLPVPNFQTDSTRISNKTANIISMIQNVAFEQKLEVVNLFPLFIEKPDLFPDKIHPSSLGASLIASRLYETITQKTDKDFDIFSTIKVEKKVSIFYGYECADFTFNSRTCKVVKPKYTAPGHPWVLRARFWGHEPQTDVSLLERGFHVVYCDVAELFGNAEAVTLWNKFYTLMQKNGLAKKVALEGMSRGGVYVYNWALANPEKVACIYADAPVLDLKSWPGGKKDAGGREPWEDFKKDYNLSEEQAMNFKNSPLDHAERIAKLGFPMLHVVGDADDVVPIAENTTPFEQRVLAAGGNIKVIHKPGVSHHPHSLQDPTPITNFILEATGYKVNFAKIKTYN